MVVAVDYRTAPTHPFPTPVNDCYATFKWVLEQAKNMGGNPEKIAIIGESAGGNLATVVSQRAKNEGLTNIKYQILLCPTTDAAHINSYPSAQKFQHGYLLDKTEIGFAYKSYASNKADLENPEVSPLLAKSLAGLPPAFVITAEFDPLHDEGRSLHETAVKRGRSRNLQRHERLHPLHSRAGYGRCNWRLAQGNCCGVKQGVPVNKPANRLQLANER